MTMHVALAAESMVVEAAVLTFILPALNGCNLKCPFCYIEQRKENSIHLHLKVHDYVNFITHIDSGETISAICIQGHEPLLPDSFKYTAELLRIGQVLNLPVSLVTNGTYLSGRLDGLAKLAPARIAVSLDSHIPKYHDRQRGVPGTFDTVIEGLRHAAASPMLCDVVDVTSVFIPKKRDQLIGMPALLADIGIKRWTVNALVKVAKGNAIGGPVGDRAKTFQDLLILQREAEKHGIEMTVDDEFGRLSDEDMNRDVVDINRLRIHRLQRPSGVFRLMPDGRCSIGTELLQEVTDDTPRWIPGEEHAADFLQRVRDRYAARQARPAA